jgi:YVTN family beta-propeller protein
MRQSLQRRAAAARWLTPLFLMALAAPTAAGEPLATRLRRPVAVQLSADEQVLYVANQRSGTLSIVDLSTQATVKEIDLGKRLSAMVAAPDRRMLLVTDEAAHELILLDANGRQVSVRQRLPVSNYPVSVVVSRDGRRCYVSSLWSRRLTFVELPTDEGAAARVTGTFDLPFAPRELLLARNDTRLMVGDAFGGRLGIVDTASGQIVLARDLPGHNIRGLGVSANRQMLLVSHQMLNELAHTVHNDVHWGLLMSNDLRWLSLDTVLDGQASLYKGAHMHPLGGASNATGDPAGLAVAADGTVVVTLAGVGEVAMGKENDFSLHRVRVGRRPTAVTVSADSGRAFVANTFGDSIAIVDVTERETLAEISLGPQAELTEADRGELLFYDARLSHDSWMSCHSCHTDGHTNGLLNDNLSDGTFGAPKRVLSLLGSADTAPFAWNAGAKDLVTQIRTSISVTMQGDQPPTEKQLSALAAYLQTLPLPPPIDEARGNLDESAVERGRALFAEQRCARCHAPPTYTTPRTYDVGLADKLGNKLFNPPSLRGVSQRGPYFHDNRAMSLDDVFRNHRHQLKRDLTDDERRDLLAFLKSL